MKKIEKAENLEAARILLITAQDLIRTAQVKVAEVQDGSLNLDSVLNFLMDSTCRVVQLQNKLHEKQ